MSPLFCIPDPFGDVQQFVADGLWNGQAGFDDASTAIGVAQVGGNGLAELCAGFVFHNFEPGYGAIEISAFALAGIGGRRGIIKRIFDYPFGQLALRIVVARTSEHNTRVRRMMRALGGEETKLPHRRADGEAEIVSILHRDAWFSSGFSNTETRCFKGKMTRCFTGKMKGATHGRR